MKSVFRSVYWHYSPTELDYYIHVTAPILYNLVQTPIFWDIYNPVMVQMRVEIND